MMSWANFIERLSPEICNITAKGLLVMDVYELQSVFKWVDKYQ